MSTIEKQLLEHLTEFQAFARKRLADPELAADAVQDSLLKALKSSRQVRQEANAKAWFYRILRRTLIDLYRHRDARKRASEKLAREFEPPTSVEADRVICACVGRLITTLKPQYATLVRRLDLNGEPLESVASELGVTPNNLRVRLHRARIQLRERLTQSCRLCAKHGCLDCTCDTTEQTED